MSGSPRAQPVRWPAEAVWQAVVADVPDFSVEIVPSIDSTNTELMRRARAGRCEPILLVTEEQTAGRGRLGRPWQSQESPHAAQERGPASLMMSLGLPLAPREWSGLSLAVGTSVADSIQPEIPRDGSGVPRVGLKWPNDLWLAGDRKFGGILVETASLVAPQGSLPQEDASGTRYVIVGVGLNVLPRPGEGMTTQPACLAEIDGRWTAPEALLRVVPPLVRTLQTFARAGFAPFKSRFAQRDLLSGRAVHLSNGASGIARGVSDDGTLLIETGAGLQPVNSGDISVRPIGQALPGIAH
ncbi:biotin--[acetyl-CoA-carboxylase] ligase [Diaphorobacter aerolatus]|uniref:biotin--[biotin carboxyl-carrier protein] ligase n=1 Tax=Diaphorobacter aerolatus TaxID=1288495 RepID=A0A7H0GGV2_9BURK|nr:biotin--[acetyl-CoA-carboxylase] ligase [Diaphorobacter aerolatus]QNP47518.1 biotin--[acetyl-CoA-carboxylase] ligase [Diaphorobacter aerolatus]